MNVKDRKFHVVVLALMCLSAAVATGEEFSDSDIAFEWLMEPQFEQAHDFYKGVAWVQEEAQGPWKLIDKTGKAIVENFFAEYVDPYAKGVDLALFSTESRKAGYVNLSGDVVIPPEYAYGSSFRENTGTAVVTQRDQDGRRIHGVIDKNGKLVMPFTHDLIVHIQPNLFALQKGKKWGYINANKEVIADFIYDSRPTPFTLPSGLYVVISEDKKRGLFSEKGELILPVSYDSIHYATEDLIAVSREGKAGFVDTGGNMIIEPSFFALPDDFSWAPPYIFSEGLAVVLLLKPEAEEQPKLNMQKFDMWLVDNVDFWVINTKGELLFKLSGVPQGYFNEGFLLVWRVSDATRWLVDKVGKRYLLPSYLEIGPPIPAQVSEGVLRLRTKADSSLYNANKYGYLKIDFD